MSTLSRLKRKIKKNLRVVGILPSYPMKNDEGHLGGYIIGKPAPGTWCTEIWDWSKNELGVESVLDVGCGLGYTMEYFASLDIDVLGVDGSPSAIRDNVMPNKVHQHDYSTAKWIPPKKIDLVWSSEFLEHVEQQYEPNFFETFKYASKFLMVTFAVPGQTGHHHVNEQEEAYWIEKIEAIGFKYDKKLTIYARNLLPKKGLRGKQFRGKGLVFRKI